MNENMNTQLCNLNHKMISFHEKQVKKANKKSYGKHFSLYFHLFTDKY